MGNEEELVKKARNRNSDAFGALYDQYQPAIYRFILFKTGHKAIAEDLTHQVFLSAWQNIEKYEQRGWPFSSWLYRMAQNQIIDHFRTKQCSSIEDCDEIPITADLGQQIDQKRELEIVQAALKELPDEQQTILIMKFVEGLTSREIAAVLGKNEITVKVCQHRSLKKLKEIINEKYPAKIK